MLLKMQPGIGDTLWCFQKLQQHLKERGPFDVEVSSTGPLRSNLAMKMVGARRVGTHRYPPQHVEKHSIKKSSELKGSVFVSINKWLESGNRIEDWLPDLPMSWTLDFNISNDSKIKAETLVGSENLVGIYTSSLTNNMQPAYNGMGVKGWLQKIIDILDYKPDSKIILLGAPYDNSLIQPIHKALQQADIPVVNTVGVKLDVTIEIIKKLNFLLAYPSGIGILGNILDTPTLMYMPRWLLNMHETWLHPQTIDKTAVHLQFNNKNETNDIMRSMIWRS